MNEFGVGPASMKNIQETSGMMIDDSLKASLWHMISNNEKGNPPYTYENIIAGMAGDPGTYDKVEDFLMTEGHGDSAKEAKHLYAQMQHDVEKYRAQKMN